MAHATPVLHAVLRGLRAEQCAAAPLPLVMEQLDVFVSAHYGGTEPFHTFRIPSLVVTRKGTLLAVVEGRKDSRSDLSNVHLVCKRSLDGGCSWGALVTIHSEPGVSDGGDADVTNGNPAPVVDLETGDIHCIFCRDNMRAFVTTSGDDGVSWSTPREITSALTSPMGQRDSDGQSCGRGPGTASSCGRVHTRGGC